MEVGFQKKSRAAAQAVLAGASAKALCGQRWQQFIFSP